MVTLAAHCLAHGVDMHEAGETELARIWTKVDTIRAKQAAKPKGSALPVALLDPAPTLAEALKLPKIAALVEALIYLVDECDEDIDDDYNPHAAPLARARATLSALEGGE